MNAGAREGHVDFFYARDVRMETLRHHAECSLNSASVSEREMPRTPGAIVYVEALAWERFTLLACLPRAVRVFFGSFEMVLPRLAARAAFFTFFRAAALCLLDAMIVPFPSY